LGAGRSDDERAVGAHREGQRSIQAGLRRWAAVAAVAEVVGTGVRCDQPVRCHTPNPHVIGNVETAVGTEYQGTGFPEAGGRRGSAVATETATSITGKRGDDAVDTDSAYPGLARLVVAVTDVHLSLGAYGQAVDDGELGRGGRPTV